MGTRIALPVGRLPASCASQRSIDSDTQLCRSSDALAQSPPALFPHPEPSDPFYAPRFYAVT